MRFGKSPSRNKHFTKMCLNCNYWTNDYFYKENKCFCCGNKYRLRKNMNLLEILSRNWLEFLRGEYEQEQQITEQQTEQQEQKQENNTIIIYSKNQ